MRLDCRCWLFCSVVWTCSVIAAISAVSPFPAEAAEKQAEAKRGPLPNRSVLDLSQFPVMEGAEVRQRSAAALTYDVAGTVPAVLAFQRHALGALQWTELEGSYESDASSSAAFECQGYRLSVSVYSAEDNKTSISLTQHGNVDLAKLPVPKSLKMLYSGPASIAYLGDDSVDATKTSCREMLVAAGWEPYGVAGDSLMFRRQTTRLTAFISSAPAQGGKTMAQFSSELLSAEIPAIPGATNIQYSDNPRQLFLDSGKSMAEVVEYYRAKFAETGWKPTTDSLIKISIYDVMIFRSPAEEMLELQLHEFEGQARALIRYRTAAEVAELDALAKQEAEKASRRKGEKPLAEKLAIAIPGEAIKVKVEPKSISFQVPTGKAQGVVDRWRKEFIKDGWKEDGGSLQAMAGAVSLSKGSPSLTISYTDVGFLPAEVTLDASGIELQRAGDALQK